MTITFDSTQQNLLREIQRHLAHMCADGARKSVFSLFTHKKTQSGIYIYGDVGRGKTTLVRHVFDQLLVPKQRHHFDTFCGQLHHLLLTQTIDEIANDIHHHCRVLWIDELQIYDIATAMLLRRLIPAFLEHHVIVLMTGNVAPDDFYKDGLNRDQFADFIPYFVQHFLCFPLEGGVDYRLISGEAKSAAPTHEPLPHSAPKRFWLVSPKLDATATVDADKVEADKVEADKIQAEMADAFQRCAPNIRPAAFTLNLNQRDWVLDKTLPSAVYIDFSALAEADHAFDDYRALVQTFPIVFLTHVPRFDAANRDACRRFMAFIDILYDGGGELYMAAQSVPADLYQDASCKLPFARTASRLAELL